MDAKTIAQLRENIEQGFYLHNANKDETRLLELLDLPHEKLCVQFLSLEKDFARLKDQLDSLSEKYEYEKSGAEDSDFVETSSEAFDDADGAIPSRIELLSPETQSYIADNSSFEQIVNALNTKVLPYIHYKAKQSLWDVVRYVLEYKGFLRKRLARQKFAELLVTLCPEAGVAKKIKQNMEQCTLTTGNRKPEDFDSLPDDNPLKQAGKEILALFC